MKLSVKLKGGGWGGLFSFCRLWCTYTRQRGGNSPCGAGMGGGGGARGGGGGGCGGYWLNSGGPNIVFRSK